MQQQALKDRLTDELKPTLMSIIFVSLIYIAFVGLTAWLVNRYENPVVLYGLPPYLITLTIYFFALVTTVIYTEIQKNDSNGFILFSGGLLTLFLVCFGLINFLYFPYPKHNFLVTFSPLIGFDFILCISPPLSWSLERINVDIKEFMLFCTICALLAFAAVEIFICLDF